MSANAGVWPGQGHIPSESLQPPIQWVGFGGERMAQLGCRLLDNTVKRAVMIYNVLGQLGYYRKLIKQANTYFAENKVDLVIVCDSPAFNFHIAKAGEEARCSRVVLCCAATVGVGAVANSVSSADAAINWPAFCRLRRTGFAVGALTPSLSPIRCLTKWTIDLQQNFKPYTSYDPSSPKIALLPGSRNAEIKSLWPAMLDIAAALKKKHPGATFTACAPDDEKLAMLKEIADGYIADYIGDNINIDYEVNKLINVAKQSDFALVASGSVTLQVAAAGCPMVVMYQSSPYMWHLVGRWLIRTRFLSLVNILAGQELVPEFMPYFTSIEPIVKAAESLLCNASKMAQTSQLLIELVRPLTERRACDTVAEIVIKMIQ